MKMLCLVLVAAIVSSHLFGAEADLTVNEKQIMLDYFNYIRAKQHRHQLVCKI